MNFKLVKAHCYLEIIYLWNHYLTKTFGQKCITFQVNGTTRAMYFQILEILKWVISRAYSLLLWITFFVLLITTRYSDSEANSYGHLIPHCSSSISFSLTCVGSLNWFSKGKWEDKYCSFFISKPSRRNYSVNHHLWFQNLWMERIWNAGNIECLSFQTAFTLV